MKRLILGGAAVALMLAGCDSPTSAVETRDRGPATTEATMTAAAAPATAVEAPAEAPGAMTSNRSESVDEKVRRLFERNGAAFGARTPEAYLAQVEAFTKRTPSDVERATRPNGDVLLYQASTNTFAVVDSDGVARTMFKPDEGAAYWEEQKARAPTFGQRRASN